MRLQLILKVITNAFLQDEKNPKPKQNKHCVEFITGLGACGKLLSRSLYFKYQINHIKYKSKYNSKIDHSNVGIAYCKAFLLLSVENTKLICCRVETNLQINM